MKQTATAKATKAKPRSDAIEGDVHRILRDRNMTIEDRASQSLMMLTQVMTQDIEAQHDHICDLHEQKNVSKADAEICRLMRMLEKRKKMIDKLESALSSSLS